MRWGFCILRAFLEFGYNKEIDKEMNEILASLDVPPIMALPEEHLNGDMGMPPILINTIFKTEFNQDQQKLLWRWIKTYFINNISKPYHYLSLLLFLEHHHSMFLQNPHLFNTDMQVQMRGWFPDAKVHCSSDSLGTYRNGFFSSDNFSYGKWLNSNEKPPKSDGYRKDQTPTGFDALNKLCNDLELNLSELKF